MKQVFTFLFAMILTVGTLQAQTLEELKAQKAELAAKQAEAQGLADGFAGEIAGLQKQIQILTGWQTGLSGTIGFDLGSSNNWVAAPNKDASSTGLGINISAFANNIKEKTLWRNGLSISKAWQDVDAGPEFDEAGNPIDDNVFDNGTVDLLSLSSLYGYRIHPKFAITALGELNTSVENFLRPGSADFGIGGTWTPSNNLVVVIHPLNYHHAWSAEGVGGSTGALGAKIRAEYGNTYNIGGKNFTLSSALTTFLPYGGSLAVDYDGVDGPGASIDASLFEYSWINTVSFELIKGIGVGVGFGFRGSEVESATSQSYYNVGLNYGLSY